MIYVPAARRSLRLKARFLHPGCLYRGAFFVRSLHPGRFAGALRMVLRSLRVLILPPSNCPRQLFAQRHYGKLSFRMSPMTTRDFKVFLEPDEDYGGYVVVCPSIPGCYSQGKTVPEALANIREAIDLCIEDMESRGEKIPNPNNVLIGSVVVTR
jgi:antitoxin HicB